MKARFGDSPASEGPKLRLPARALFLGWGIASVVALIACWVGSPLLEGLWGDSSAEGLDSGSKSGAAVLGAAISAVMSGIGLLAVLPWRARPAMDMPLVWMASTVIRFLATPAVAFVLYFAIRPQVKPFVLGLAFCYLVLLFVEVLITVFDLRHQLDRIEMEQVSEGS